MMIDPSCGVRSGLNMKGKQRKQAGRQNQSLGEGWEGNTHKEGEGGGGFCPETGKGNNT